MLVIALIVSVLWTMSYAVSIRPFCQAANP
jgi:hypothetical protein